MQSKPFPVIDLVATGQNILRLREERGMSVRDLQAYFGFEEPQAIYKWQRGKCLPSVDNLYALGCLLEVPLEEILVRAAPNLNYIHTEQQASACCSFAAGKPCRNKTSANDTKFAEVLLFCRWSRRHIAPVHACMRPCLSA